ELKCHETQIHRNRSQTTHPQHTRPAGAARFRLGGALRGRNPGTESGRETQSRPFPGGVRVSALKRLAEIDKTLPQHDTALRDVYRKLLPLLQPPPDPP